VKKKTPAPAGPPAEFNVAELLALDVPAPKALIEGLIPLRGVSLMIGKPKSGKTLLSLQLTIAVASGQALFDTYRVLEPGAVLMVAQDDPGSTASVKDILHRSSISVAGIPFTLVPKVPFYFGLDLIDWLEKQIVSKSLRLIVLDSYTALRGPRKAGCDLVKTEQNDLLMLDELAKRTNCAIVLIHHGSKGSAAMDWTEQAAGSFAMAAAVEAQIHISRFSDLESTAPERLVRVQGRHLSGTEFVLRLVKQSLSYEHLLEGGAASLYPLIQQLQAYFGAQAFSPKDLAHTSGVSRATANRQLNRLYMANVISKKG
jgi:RecA-family ATPase